MSAELLPVSEPDENAEASQEIPVGGSKPLHRFLKGQPKIIGTVVLIMGLSFVIVSIPITTDHFSHRNLSVIHPGIFLGTLFIISGILYILTERSPTKKTVTVSLAFSIVTILGAFWSVLHILSQIHIRFVLYKYEDYSNETTTYKQWSTYYYLLAQVTEVIFVVHGFVGAIIFIIMSAFAGAALRSTKTQAVVVMHVTATETPVE